MLLTTMSSLYCRTVAPKLLNAASRSCELYLLDTASCSRSGPGICLDRLCGTQTANQFRNENHCDDVCTDTFAPRTFALLSGYL